MQCTPLAGADGARRPGCVALWRTDPSRVDTGMNGSNVCFPCPTAGCDNTLGAEHWRGQPLQLKCSICKAQFELSCDTSDASGDVQFFAKDVATSTKTEVTITVDPGRLSQDDIERMVKQAEKWMAEDSAKKERSSDLGQVPAGDAPKPAAAVGGACAVAPLDVAQDGGALKTATLGSGGDLPAAGDQVTVTEDPEPAAVEDPHMNAKGAPAMQTQHQQQGLAESADEDAAETPEMELERNLSVRTARSSKDLDSLNAKLEALEERFRSLEDLPSASTQKILLGMKVELEQLDGGMDEVMLGGLMGESTLRPLKRSMLQRCGTLQTAVETKLQSAMHRPPS